MSNVLPPGQRTDLGILRLQGAQVSDRGDHLVIRSPANPEFHWGNFVLVTTGDPEDADRWLTVFAAEFPQAGHVAIDLPSLPRTDRYAAHGVSLDTDTVLTSSAIPRQRPLAEGYIVRELVTDDDWERVVHRAVAENDVTGEQEPAGFERFSRDQAAARRALIATGNAAFFGVFAGGDLAAELGIVLLGDTARYQSVGTQAEHRRRGLAGHLLGVAARWAADRGATEWVIVTESTNPAARLYRSVGFADAAQTVQAYRTPGAEASYRRPHPVTG
ncbi:GNAT family N-acetyltransferase [Flexivirga caeni]|uniref:GNAT family N-acetyltransferase n=1 Tax=Flexivirga caeni TaxID=2294115 RepID=A0A3M9MFG2_9MICO|nr:GNAT family N-acetyltransferase [Flexivirga caeni]RNI23935.1 GNAT family N-acetyltransferase [Flexivirga caeni]